MYFARFFLLACAVFFISDRAIASTHVALVIGNAKYKSVAPLKNTVNDASDISDKLSSLGYDVKLLIDADYRTIRTTLRSFRKTARDADFALIYFAGHGIEIDKYNFLLPVDAKLEEPDDIDLEAIPLQRFSDSVAGAKKLNVIMLDACRDNPFLETMNKEHATRSVGSRGLGRVDPKKQSIISFAASEGKVASDGEDRNSPYAKAILNNLDQQNLEVGFFFRNVKSVVERATSSKQSPVFYSGLSDEKLYLHPKGGSDLAAIKDIEPIQQQQDPAPAQVIVQKPSLEERAGEIWPHIKDSDNIKLLEYFVEQYGKTFFATMAKVRIEEVLEIQKKEKREQERIERLKRERETQEKEEREKQEREEREREARKLALAEQERREREARKPIRSMLSVYRDIDLFGGDIGNGEKASSLDQCATICGRTYGCSAFTYIRSRRTCYLKNGYEHVQALSGAYAGIVFKGRQQSEAPDLKVDWEFYLKRDLPTRSDFRTIQKIYSYSACLSACESYSRCVGVTYSSKLNKCWLKDQANIRPVKNSSATRYNLLSSIRISRIQSPVTVIDMGED